MCLDCKDIREENHEYEKTNGDDRIADLSMVKVAVSSAPLPYN
jgi:hypothetical protein